MNLEFGEDYHFRLLVVRQEGEGRAIEKVQASHHCQMQLHSYDLVVGRAQKNIDNIEKKQEQSE